MSDNSLPLAIQSTLEILPPLSIAEMQHRIQLIQHALKHVMKEGIHYGTIPGCGDKPALLKPGSEIICSMFRFVPILNIETKDMGSGHREVITTVTIKDPMGHIIGQGIGSCSTMESKYRWRKSERQCPKCGKPAIKQSKYDDKGWYCYNKIGGCGLKFLANDAAIMNQAEGRMENPDIADQYNTVLKISKKRGITDAVLTATACSDIFSQDVDEDYDLDDAPPVRTGPAPAPEKEKAQQLNQQLKAKKSPKSEAPLQIRLEMMTEAFDKHKITLSMLEERIGTTVDNFSEQNLKELREIYSELEVGLDPQSYFPTAS